MESLKRRKQAGHTLLEVIVVVGIVAAVIGYIAFGPNIFGKKNHVEIAVEQLHKAINEARNPALNGIENESERTFDLAKLELPQGVVIENQVRDLPVDAPTIGRIVFEPQSGLAPQIYVRALPGQPVTGWGWVVFSSLTERDRVAVLIPYRPGPLLQYRYAQGKWQLMQSALY